ncbi:MAG: HAD-IA family hydrolase [Candidatus Bathyarchaeia archaeon]
MEENTSGRAPIRCILFDLDGTLYDSKEYSKYFDSQMSEIVSNFLKVGKDEASRILQERRKKEGTLTRAIESLGLGRLEFHELVAAQVDPSVFLTTDIETREVISRLKQTGLKIALVSNSGRNLVVKILDAVGLEQGLFDAIITGTDAEPKPSHKPFLLAMKELGYDSANAVYVGDRDEAEIRPAHEIGLRTVLLSRNADERSNAKWADVVIGDIAELEKAVIGLNQSSTTP